MRNIALVGNGGHAKVIRDMIAAQGEYKLIALFDNKNKTIFNENDILYGPISSLHELSASMDFQVAIAIGNNQVRKGIVAMLNLPDERYATIIHPSAVISESVSIGAGTVVMPNVVINADTCVGKHTILNTACVVEHDNQIGDFVHISPRAALTGAVHIGEGTQIGTGACIIPGIKVGEWSTVGAGAAVIRNIPSACTAVGNPARVIKSNM